MRYRERVAELVSSTGGYTKIGKKEEYTMYSYTFGYEQEEVFVPKGQVMAGFAIGIILFGHPSVSYPMPPGSVENATTFDFPVHFRAIESASTERAVSPKPDPLVLKDLIKAGKELEQQGCRAIIGGCGYFANYLPEVVKELNVPCFLSSMMQIPMIARSLKPSQKIGIVCAHGGVLAAAPALKNCGVNDLSTVVIAGAENLPEMKKILQCVGHCNPGKLERELVGLTKQMVKDNPNIGAILLECTLFPTYARAVQEAVRLPVFDFTTMINWVHNAVVRRTFAGYM
jgi:hypothetical protein